MPSMPACTLSLLAMLSSIGPIPATLIRMFTATKHTATNIGTQLLVRLVSGITPEYLQFFEEDRGPRFGELHGEQGPPRSPGGC